jgi:hypothetical protein
MSLRAALRSAVARSTPLHVQHATRALTGATADATRVQPRPGSTHEIRTTGATADATAVQLAAATDATQWPERHAAPPGKFGTQSGALTTHRATAALMKAAMRACDEHGDDPAARAQMIEQCMSIPAQLQRDLLEHFEHAYPRL